jgi:hypothetical protein
MMRELIIRQIPDRALRTWQQSSCAFCCEVQNPPNRAPFHPHNSASLNKWVTCDKRAYQKIEEGKSKFSNILGGAIVRMKRRYLEDHALRGWIGPGSDAMIMLRLRGVRSCLARMAGKV